MMEENKVDNVVTDFRKVKDLKFYPGNPRKMDKKTLEKLRRSIREFGIVEPLVINKDNQVIGGNQRLKAIREEKIEEVPVVIVDLDKNKEKSLNLALNKIAGEWDEELLKSFIDDLDDDSLGLAGFDNVEVGNLLDNEDEVIDDNYKKSDDLGNRVIPGDIWALGNHRLMCGDSTKGENFERLMNGKKADLVFTSPPYNMDGGMYRNYDDNLKSQEYIDFNLAVINNIRSYLRGFLFWNISYNKNARWEWIEIFYRITKETGLKFLEKIVWDKGHGTPITSKKQLTRQYEDIFLAGTETAIEADLSEAYLGTVKKDWSFNKKTGKGITNYWRITTGGTQTDDLKAAFPVAIVVKGILLMTKRGEIVMDPFGGSGSTLIAAEQTGRICYMMEMDEHYCDAIIDRWEKFTGEKAKKVDNDEMV